MADQQGNDQSPNPNDQGGGEKMDELKKKIEDAKKNETDGEMQRLQEEIEALRVANEEAQSKALRALADLQNARKRMEEEKASFATFAALGLILKVLEIYENYHRLLQHKPEGIPQGEWLKGLELIDQQFQGFLDQQGVKKIDVKVGEKINPEQHEAVMSGEGEEGVVLEVFSAGYEMKGRVIKTAKVKVGKGA